MTPLGNTKLFRSFQQLDLPQSLTPERLHELTQCPLLALDLAPFIATVNRETRILSDVLRQE